MSQPTSVFLAPVRQILGRTYELRPPPHGPPAAHTAARTEDGSWSCHAVVDAASRDAERSKTSAASAIAVELPVRESSGLLWAWPDASPEGELWSCFQLYCCIGGVYWAGQCRAIVNGKGCERRVLNPATRQSETARPAIPLLSARFCSVLKEDR